MKTRIYILIVKWFERTLFKRMVRKLAEVLNQI